MQKKKCVSTDKLQISPVMDPLEGPSNMDWDSGELVSLQETLSFDGKKWTATLIAAVSSVAT